MNLRSLLSRSDDQSLQLLLGRSALELVLLLDPMLASPGKLADLVIDLYTPQGLLRSAEARSILFDLLRPNDALQLLAKLGIETSNDIYGDLKGYRFRKDSATEEVLFQFFEITKADVLPANVAEMHRIVDAGYGLFAHQRHATREVEVALTSHPRRVVLHMPTGAGKTRTAMNVICEHLRQQEPGLVIWLAFSEELCEQAASEFEQAWNYLGNRPVDIIRYWGNRTFDLSEDMDGIIIAGLSKLYNTAQRNLSFLSRLGNKTSLVIIDEAHSAIAETYSFLLDALVVQNPRTGLLGLTATPGRTWADIDVDEALADFFSRKKVTLRIQNYENPIDYLVDQGYLAHVNYRPLFHEGGEKISEVDLDRIEKNLDIPNSVLTTLADDRLRNLAIILGIEALTQRHQRIIVFATTVDHAELLSAVLRARGFNATSVTSRTESLTRGRIIEEFKKKDDMTRILCNFGVLTTGFDSPQTSAAVIARPTKSLVLYSQMVGRAIRGVKAGGNYEAEVLTVVDYNLPGFGSVAESFTNWEDVWE